MKYIILLSFITNLAIAQSGAVYETYKTTGNGTNQSHGTIFNKPFQQYNYIKTHRGIEVYETYKTLGNGTNQSHGTIFSKPFPEYVIIGEKIYKTYKNNNGTNQSSGTIFTQPFQSKDISQNSKIESIRLNIQSQIKNKCAQDYPKYDGSGEIFYGE